MGKDSRQDSSKGFATSALKEYPEVCRALAALAVNRLATHCDPADARDSTFDSSLCAPSRANLEGLFERGAGTRGRRTENN